jgi:cell volume regulation protein A
MSEYGIPDSMLMITSGIILGPVLGLLNTDTLAFFAPYIGALALIAIMFDSGLSSDLRKLVGESKHGLILALISFFISVTVIVLVLHSIPNFLGFSTLSFNEALLYGTIVGGSSGVVVASIAKKISMRDELKTILTLESILTDAFCIIGALTVILIISSPTIGFQELSTFIAAKFSVSLVTGFAFGFLIVNLIHRRFPYGVVLAVLMLLYGFTEYIGGNGAIAIFITGIVVANLKHLSFLFSKPLVDSVNGKKPSIEWLHSELSFFIKVFFYLAVGLMLDINIFDPMGLSSLLLGLSISFLLILTRYPAAFVVSKMAHVKNTKLISIFYARGLAAAVLAFLAGDLFPNSQFYLQSIAAVIVFTNLIMTVLCFYFNRGSYRLPTLLKKNSLSRKDSSLYQ